MVEFSNFLLGQKFVVVEFKFSIIGQKFIAVEFKFEFCKGRPPLAMPNGTNTPVSHIILYELSYCILYRQTNGTLWINFSMFFGKLALKKAKFADPPAPIVHNCCEIFCHFFYFFFLCLRGFSNLQAYLTEATYLHNIRCPKKMANLTYIQNINYQSFKPLVLVHENKSYFPSSVTIFVISSLTHTLWCQCSEDACVVPCLKGSIIHIINLSLNATKSTGFLIKMGLEVFNCMSIPNTIKVLIDDAVDVTIQTDIKMKNNIWI